MEQKPQIVELNASELESLLDQIEAQLGAQTVSPLRLLLASYLALMRVIESKTASIQRLRRMLFGAKTERTSQVVGGVETTVPFRQGCKISFGAAARHRQSRRGR